MTTNRRIAVASLLLTAVAAVARAQTPTTMPATAPATRPVGPLVAVRLPATRPTVAPFELMPSGHIAIMAMINGLGPYRFVLDTGAPMTLINEKVAKSAGVLPKHFRRPFFTPLGNLGDHAVKSIDVGGGHEDKATAQVWNHPTVDLLAKSEGPLEGIIGFPFFSRFHATIDYRARTITLVPSGYQPVDTTEKMQAAMQSDETPTLAPVMSLGLKLTKGDAAAPGVTVSAVLSDGPAAAAGVRVGDRLLTLDNRWTDAVDDVYAAAADVDRGTTHVPLTLSRDGAVMTLQFPVKPGL